jgi:hypothetical protein
MMRFSSVQRNLKRSFLVDGNRALAFWQILSSDVFLLLIWPKGPLRQVANLIGGFKEA